LNLHLETPVLTVCLPISLLLAEQTKIQLLQFYNYKQGNGFRPSDFESKNYFANLNYQLNDKTSLHFDYTYFNYLAQQQAD
jgi:Fe(3+) dicitrate transport protein